RRNPMA
ncbi:hypothetical protein KFL_012420015, partial [Klebsormidium nitens]